MVASNLDHLGTCVETAFYNESKEAFNTVLKSHQAALSLQEPN